MKKRIVAVLLSLAMVFGVVGAGARESKASEGSIIYYSIDNMDCISDESTYGPELREFFEELKESNISSYNDMCAAYHIGEKVSVLATEELGSGLTPGNILTAGDVVTSNGKNLEYFLFLPNPLQESFTVSVAAAEAEAFEPAILSTGYTEEELFEEMNKYCLKGSNLREYDDEFSEGKSKITIPEKNGVKAWLIMGAFVMPLGASPIAILLLVPVKDSSLVKTGNTTQWVDGTGRVLWTITEEEDKIVANLTDCSAVKAEYVKEWNESGKALSITYKYNGYTVAIDVPAGELTDTGAEWYGPEYLAAVNQKYVVVKDSTGLVVPNDRIYKK